MRNRDLKLLRVERVALRHVAGGPAAFEPAHTLGGGAVSEGIGNDGAAGLHLQAVVADDLGTSQRFFNVAGIEEIEALLGVIGPDSGKKVGL